jgi:DDE superfamily endonuclease
MSGVDPARLVFVDECGTHTSMTRRRARAVRGERARGSVPRNRGPVTTLLAGVSLAGMRPAMTVEGGTDTAVFATYLEHVLLPGLAPGTVVVVDNVGAHRPDRIRALIAAAGCRLVFLPAVPARRGRCSSSGTTAPPRTTATSPGRRRCCGTC